MPFGPAGQAALVGGATAPSSLAADAIVSKQNTGKFNLGKILKSPRNLGVAAGAGAIAGGLTYAFPWKQKGKDND